jgi:magnesium transporter
MDEAATDDGLDTLPVRLRTAAAHVAVDVPIAGPADTAGEARRSLEGIRFASVADIAVCEGERLLGLVTIEELMAAPATAPLSEIMDTTPPVIGPHVTEQIASWQMVQQGESSLAVVDPDGRLVGLIPPVRMLEVLLEEHEEDLSRLAGVLHDAGSARRASEEPVRRRLWHRLPWLLVGLVGAMASASLLGSFESRLEQKVMLAFFVPAIVYMADAVGTQTETLAVRGLSVGVGIRSVARKEAATGGLIGLFIGAAFLPFALLAFGDQQVAITVAISLVLACSVASAVALVLPWGFARFDRDPAFGSGPLATVIQDLLSLLIYLSVASVLVF